MPFVVAHTRWQLFRNACTHGRSCRINKARIISSVEFSRVVVQKGRLSSYCPRPPKVHGITYYTSGGANTFPLLMIERFSMWSTGMH